ncbi:MAG: DUF6089 family protein [Luteibaculaceae bacterium]
MNLTQNYTKNLLFKSFCITALVLLNFNTSNAQFRQDFGLNLGVANYLGDIGGGAGAPTGFISDMQFSQTRPTVGVFYRYRVYGNFYASAHFNYVRIQNADSLSGNPHRMARNINFRNNMFELATRVDYAFYKITDVGRRGLYRNDLSFYAFAGVGAVFHNPQGLHEHPDGSGAQWFNLREFNTEGPNTYSRTALIMPLGLGVSFTRAKHWRFGLEVSWRFTNTDYLDDTSTVYPDQEFLTSPLHSLLSSPTNQDIVNRAFEGTGESPDVIFWQAPGAKRGNPNRDDGYLIVNFTLSYVIKGKPDFQKSRYSFMSERRKSKIRF